MRKVIAAINMTLDGFCDHTAISPGEDVHRHYEELLNEGGVILYGRITYQLMQFWQELIKNPSGEKSMDDFATSIDSIPKIVFSHTLQNTDWESATLADQPIKLQLCIHPVIAKNGLPLFENINDRTVLKLTKTKTFTSGGIIHYYEMGHE
jgi:dihydrofolate reductase